MDYNYWVSFVFCILYFVFGPLYFGIELMLFMQMPEREEELCFLLRGHSLEYALIMGLYTEVGLWDGIQR